MICGCTLGWAANDKMSEVNIRWPNGETEILRDVPADFIYTLVEGAGIQQKVALPSDEYRKRNGIGVRRDHQPE
jgi:hypothetical protein